MLDALVGEGARGRPDRERLRRARDRRQPRRLPREPRPRHRHAARTAPPGSRSFAASSRAASPASSSSPPTRTPASSTRSAPRCPARPGSGAARTSCATSSRASRRRAQRAVATMVRSIFDQADADQVHEQYHARPGRNSPSASRRRRAARASRPRPACFTALRPASGASSSNQAPRRSSTWPHNPQTARTTRSHSYTT